MILRSVELESFGRFRAQTVEFRRGMNLVIGPNEAGKSTLAEAVPAVLFGTDRLERYKPWGRNVCTAALFFEGGGRTIQIKRNLVTDDVELLEKDDLYHVLAQFSGRVPLGGRSTPCREYRDLLETLLGVADERLFRATYFFGHHPQEWCGDELAKKLRTLVSGTAETDYAEILDGLLAEHFALTRSNPWGRDKQRDREYEEVCRQLERNAGGEAVPMFVEIDNSAELEAQVAALADELSRDRQEYEKGLRYVERVRSQLQIPAESAEPEPALESEPACPPPGPPQADTADLPGQLAAAGLPQKPPRELPQLLTDAAEIRQELATLQQPFAALNSREQKIPRLPWAGLLCAAGLLLVGLMVAWWLGLPLLWLALGAGACAALLAGWAGWRTLAANKAQAECRKERSRLDQLKMLAQKRQAALSERCEALGLPSSAIDLVRLQKQVNAHRELLERYWALQEPAAPVADLKTAALADSPAAECAPAAGQVPVAAQPAATELAEIDARITEFAAGMKQKEARLKELRQLLQETAASSPRTAISATVLQARKRELEERIAVLRKAVDLLAGAVEEFGRSHLAGLNTEASKLFGKITGGRYGALQLDDNMTPQVQVDGRRWMSFEHFSRGTVDAIYLSLRIALAKVRNDGRSLPLMLDDPFVHLDQKRLTTALNLIDLAAADGQLILFSHNQELGKRAARERWHVVPLDGDTVNVSSEEGGEHAGQLHLL